MSVLFMFCLFLSCAESFAQDIQPERTSLSAAIAAATSSTGYKVTTVKVAPTKMTEYRLAYQGKHFLSVIMDANGAMAIRPHPGNDTNGWGSTWYPESFLPGATLRKSGVSLKATATNINLKASGIVSKGSSDSFGTWTMVLSFSFDPVNKQILATGNYVVKLKGALSDITGDLNICKIASNYLTNVPLIGGGTGDTGDMKQADVSNDFGSYVWIPKLQPAFFPQERTLTLDIDVEGQRNNVNTAAQGFPAIVSAYKPSLRVFYELQLPTSSSTASSSIVGGLIPKTAWSDEFTGKKMSSSIWKIPTWVSSSDGTYFGRTQVRCSQNSPLPAIKGGNAKILLETYNPTGYSFYGTDLIAKQSVSLGQGVLVTVVAKAEAPFPGGIVAGIFLYALKAGSDTLHDEIDFELVSNQPYQIATNIYGDEPLGTGHPASYPFSSGSITDYHKYQILWLPNRVSWYVDGVLVRTVTTQSPIPTGPMYVHINMWAPGSDWSAAYNTR